LKQKILITGPFLDFGGRELEVGFISNTLSSKYNIEICSTVTFSSKSQVLDFDKNLKTFSLKGKICKEFRIIKSLAFISYLKNKCKGSISDYANNEWAKKYFKYENKAVKTLNGLVPKYDLIIFIGQISSVYTKEIIEISNKNKVKIIFRTTGKILDFQQYDYLNKVDLFIHHSKKNASNLRIRNHNYKIIDQCAFNEKELLKIPIVKSKIKTFLTIARLEKEKNIDVVIKAFLKNSDNRKLIIIGDGSEYFNLRKLAGDNTNITFTGFIPNHKISEFFRQAECIIISHYDFETGPLTGVEAMASARLILSAKTGAMQERFSGINISCFNNSLDDLSVEMMKINNLDMNEIEKLSIEIRQRYTLHYSMKEIGSEYLKVVDEIISFI
jgi:glycosyltransferase involved in cell wall biosynthesis